VLEKVQARRGKIGVMRRELNIGDWIMFLGMAITGIGILLMAMGK
jgi:hypothetical protein